MTAAASTPTPNWGRYSIVNNHSLDNVFFKWSESTIKLIRADAECRCITRSNNSCEMIVHNRQWKLIKWKWGYNNQSSMGAIGSSKIAVVNALLVMTGVRTDNQSGMLGMNASPVATTTTSAVSEWQSFENERATSRWWCNTQWNRWLLDAAHRALWLQCYLRSSDE